MQNFLLKCLPYTVCAVIFTHPSAQAKELRGDWQSSGGMQRPWMPSYEYQYDCQIEITDEKERVSSGGEIIESQRYQLYAVHKFRLDKAHSQFSKGKNWKYVAKMGANHPGESEELLLNAAPEGAFVPERESVGISFQPGKKGEPDQVQLYAYTEVQLGAGYYLPQSGRETFSRRSKSFDLRVSARLYRDHGNTEREDPVRSQERHLYVVCDKVK